MTQSNETKREILEIVEMVRTLRRAAVLESRVCPDDGSIHHNKGKIDAYNTVYNIIGDVLKLCPVEFNREVDEFIVSRLMDIKENGEYTLHYKDGRIVIIRS